MHVSRLKYNENNTALKRCVGYTIDDA